MVTLLVAMLIPVAMPTSLLAEPSGSKHRYDEVTPRYDLTANSVAQALADAHDLGVKSRPLHGTSGPPVALSVELQAPRQLDGAVGAFCSFTGTTAVLMADGTTKALADVAVGDWVMAEDPETGERGPRRVTDVWVHEDEVTDLVVDGDVVTTTEDHPFWNATDGEWQRADALDRGDFLLAADGGLLAVHHGLDAASVRTTTAYNLTVDGVHTYFVIAGDDEVLVHNTCDIPGNPFRGSNAPQRAFDHLEEFHGLDPHVASNRLHAIKQHFGIGAADDVVIGRTGDVYNAQTGDWLGTLTDSGWGR